MKVPYPHPTSEAVSAVMQGNRRSDTRPEKRLRSALHRLGFRFRKDFPIDVGESRRPRPDIVFTRRRVAIFVDGCFWHLCPQHGRIPNGANRSYWERKLRTNQARDRADTQALVEAGWTVVRTWEHDALDEVLREVLNILGTEPVDKTSRRPSPLPTTRS